MGQRGQQPPLPFRQVVRHGEALGGQRGVHEACGVAGEGAVKRAVPQDGGDLARRRFVLRCIGQGQQQFRRVQPQRPGRRMLARAQPGGGAGQGRPFQQSGGAQGGEGLHARSMRGKE